MTEDAALDPERALALTYVPREVRDRVGTLWRLDERLALLGASPSQFREIKLAWWEEQLSALTPAGHAEPLLAQTARDLLPGLPAADLARLAEGWRTVGKGDVGADYAAARARLFPLTARLIGAPLPEQAHADALLWARADLRRLRPDLVQAEPATPSLGRWPKPLRALGALAIVSARDLSSSELDPRPSPSRVARMAWHRLSGL